MKINRDKSGFVFRGEKFMSYQEVQCYKYLQWLGLASKDINHEYHVGRYSYDFFPLGRIFWEHHPIFFRNGEDLFQYGKRRRLVLNASGYSKTPLVVSDVMFKDQWEVCDLMNDYDVDFKQGLVKGNPSICFVRNYWSDYLSEKIQELLAEATTLDLPASVPN